MNTVFTGAYVNSGINMCIHGNKFLKFVLLFS
jgi:hypothetical protein